MLYGRRLDEALEHVDGSRYALVHAVSKRARQITLWLTADPAELRSEDAPPPSPGELSSRDPVALAEAEILAGDVDVRWDPDGTPEERELPQATAFEADPLLLERDDDEVFETEETAGAVTATLAEALEAVASGEATTVLAASDASIVGPGVDDANDLLDADDDAGVDLAADLPETETE